MHDARIADPRQHPPLGHEPLAQKRAVLPGEDKRLERQPDAQPLVFNFIDLAHAALPERLHDAIGPDQTPDLEAHLTGVCEGNRTTHERANGGRTHRPAFAFAERSSNGR